MIGVCTGYILKTIGGLHHKQKGVYPDHSTYIYVCKPSRVALKQDGQQITSVQSISQSTNN